ncbi:MAG: chromosome segregation SMC family protein, partial [Candidatus Diapherotrites archaeon]
MVKISKLILKNFKSFKKAEIPFSNGFTAIVGANASGKSNVLDALLFAFGATSLKLLRASRLTELVHHDAEEGYAKVTAELSDGDKTISISRIIDRQGKSIVKLDGKRKSLNEVAALLLELGIRPTGHNIVVQGDVTKIIEMTAKERRGIIDEVAGLAEFEEKKEESIKKLDKVDARIKDATLVLNERESYLEGLSAEREAALKFNELGKELKSSKATIINEEFRRIKAEMAGANKKNDAMREEIERRIKEKESLKSEEKELEKKIEGITEKMIHASEKTYSTFGREVEEKKGELRLVKERLERAEERIVASSSRQQELKERQRELLKIKLEKKEHLKILTDKMGELKSQIGRISSLVEARSAKVEKKGDKVKSDEERLAAVMDDLGELRKEFYSKGSKADSLSREIEMKGEERDKLLKAVDDLRNRVLRRKELEKKIEKLSSPNPRGLIERNDVENGSERNMLGYLKSRRDSLKEAKKSIGEADSFCPICENVLNEKAKSGLIAKKAKEIEEAEKGIVLQEGKISRLLKERKELEARLEEMQKTGYEIKALAPSQGELEEAESKLKRLNLDEMRKEIGFLNSSKAVLEGKIKKLEAEKKETHDRVEAFRKSEENVELGSLIDKQNKLQEAKGLQENDYARTETELKEGIAREEGAIAKEMESLLDEFGKLKIEKEKNSGIFSGLSEEIEKRKAELDRAENENRLLEEEKGRLGTKLSNLNEKLATTEAKVEILEKGLNEIAIEQSKNEVRVVDLEQELNEYEGVKMLKEFTLPELKKRVPEIEREIAALGAINMKALESFDHYRVEVEDMRGKAKKLDEERLAVLNLIDKIEVKKLNIFMDCFNHINRKFNELYYSFFSGEGKLGLSDEENPLEGGLLIQAKYKEDKLKSIDAMSGGEKSLTALAFLFAIQSFEPAPFYILDEVDAALDKENSLKIGRMIKEISGQSQFISITHNDSIV